MRRMRRVGPVRYAAAAVAALLATVALTACTPTYIVTVANRTDRTLALWLGNERLGYIAPEVFWRSDGFDLGAPDPIDVPVRAISEDGSLAAVLDNLPIAEGDVLIIRDADLHPSTATATVVNDTDTARKVRLTSSDWVDLAHGERAVVSLGAPAGGCVVYPDGQTLDPSLGSTPVPAAWGGRLCDGDVVGLADPVPRPIYVNNASTHVVIVQDESTTLDTIDPGVVGRVAAPEGGCTTGELQILARHQSQVVPPGVCEGDTITVDLPPMATVEFENRTADDVFATGQIPQAYSASIFQEQIELLAGQRDAMELSIPDGACTEIWIGTTTWADLTVAAWTGEVCDGDLFTLDPPAGSDSATWVRSSQYEE